MNLIYSFEIKTVISTQRQLPIIKLEAPYQMLFELGQFDTAEQAKNLWQGIEQGLKEPRTEPLYLGLNQIALDIYPQKTTIHFMSNNMQKMMYKQRGANHSFSRWSSIDVFTNELLRLLKDWAVFLEEQQR